MSRKSLSALLSWQVGAIQLATFLASLSILLALTWAPSVQSVPTQLATDVASALVDDGEALRLDRSRLPRSFVAQEQDAWLVAKSSAGTSLTVGRVPVELATLAAQVDLLQETQLRSDVGRLAATIVVIERGGVPVKVMVGGIPSEGIGETLFVIGKYIFMPMFLPVLLTTALVIPWVIRRRLRGLRRLAADASTIDLDRRASLLDADDLPAEVQPLVASFNVALSRIWDASATRDRFLADAAHELRMPMAVLRTRLSSLAHSKEKVRLMHDLSRLETIAEQLLDLQRLERSTESRRDIDLAELCDELAAEIAPQIIEHGHEFSFHRDAAPVMIRGERGALQRMIKNLLHNAMIHGGQGGSISLEVRAGGCIRVSDSGPGIPLDERQRVFSPFYRLNPAVDGSGLGLHLASEVAAKHGGRIRVGDSAAGGASFEVILPTLGTSIQADNSERLDDH